MFRTTLKLSVVLAASISLSGCATIFGHQFALFGHPRSSMERAPQLSSTSEGRADLDAGRTGKAIEAFQVALATGEPSAPALNGLGVAYARLGRPDVAANLFKQAMAADPADKRYAANLSKAMQTQQFAARTRQALAERDASPSQPATATAPAADSSGSKEPGQLTRVGKREYVINSVKRGEVPTRRQALAMNTHFKPLFRVEFRHSAGDQANTPDEQAPDERANETITVGTSRKVSKDFKPIVRMDLPPVSSAHSR